MRMKTSHFWLLRVMRVEPIERIAKYCGTTRGGHHCAALEGPPALSGLTPEMRADVEQAYVRAHHAQTLSTMEDRQEALDLVGAAAEIAMMGVRNHVGLAPDEFERWFATAANSGGAHGREPELPFGKAWHSPQSNECAAPCHALNQIEVSGCGVPDAI
jgi:hypothetical protein